MRGSNRIQHKPYIPTLCDKNAPYICRLAPFATGFEFEWLDQGNGPYTVYYGFSGMKDRQTMPICEPVITVEGLETDCTYEFYIEAQDGRRSRTRLVRTGALPEGATVINYLHQKDGQYDFSGRFLCSPSLARTPKGRLVAGMDVYGPDMPQNLTILCYSEDDGKHWRYLTDLYPFYWGSLFCHKGVLYILGLTTEYGNLQIACSTDDGDTWSAPVTLFYGSERNCKYGGVHRAPMQLTMYGDRLYTSVEYGSWKMHSHLPAILSIGKDEDPMVAENWIKSEHLRFEGNWKEAANGQQGDTMEGNLIVGPDGNFYNYMRWKSGSYLRLKVNTEDLNQAPKFDGIFSAPVTNSMFRIIPDGERYLVLTNYLTEETAKHYALEWARNVLSVFETKDMEHFTKLTDVVDRGTENPQQIGFQYPSFIYENGEILTTVRSAFNDADNYHNSNYNLFFRIPIK